LGVSIPDLEPIVGPLGKGGYRVSMFRDNTRFPSSQVACSVDRLRRLLLEPMRMRNGDGVRRLSMAWALALGFVGSPALGIGADQAPQVPPHQVPIDQLDGIQRATIILDSYSYTPQHVIVQAGKPVELILTSITTITPHNFLLKDEAAGLSIERDVSSGRTVTVQFTVTKPGRYRFYCDKKLLFFPSHQEKGMEGVLEVR